MRNHQNITQRLRLWSGMAFAASTADGFVPWTGDDPHLAFASAESKHLDRVGFRLPGACGFNPYRGLGP